jgi:DEAD/DEAH box helicase domain-containing protein
MADPTAKAMYVFPLKALAQDQLRVFSELANRLSGRQPTAAIYDGDTTAWFRKKIRRAPPEALLTNPEMLHLAFLPYHRKWIPVFAGLKFVVVDEIHTYRGVLGAHMALVLRRLQRICHHYGSSPTFIFCSATVANPAEFAQQLSGLNVAPVTEGNAPRGRRHILLMDPEQGPARTAILLLKAALHRGLRTIVYTQSRKLTELLAVWSGSQAGRFADRIRAYRAGFLPQERRAIEKKLATGDLLAVISTSALELGIDIGDLDLCLLVGYPGSVVALLQRAGRVGRSGQDSATILIAGQDALDQYFLRNPQDLINKAPEAAVINPFNPEILSRHLVCAAAEMPLGENEPLMSGVAIRQAAADLEQKGDLLKSADGMHWYAKRRAPHREIDLRGTGIRFNIIDRHSGQHTGEIDGFRAFSETHPGAIYLHQGETYLVADLDLATRIVTVSAARVNYYTRARTEKETDIIEADDENSLWGIPIGAGRLKITDRVTGYEKWRIRPRQKIAAFDLDLPPLVFDTDGFWLAIPHMVESATQSNHIDFLGSLHAIEHAVIGMFPLVVMSDRNDLAGFSTLYHPQLGSAAIFIYDAIPGGAGLSKMAYAKLGKLLAYTLKAIKECPCESGCPSCVHSPKCGSGNRPIDKQGAIILLEKWCFAAGKTTAAGEVDNAPATLNYANNNPSVSQAAVRKIESTAEKDASATKPVEHKPKGRAGRPETRFGVLDLETQRSAAEVGGWHRAHRMGISCAILFDSRTGQFLTFTDKEVLQLIEDLKNLELIVGFNIKRFDYRVLAGYADFDFNRLPTLDLLEAIHTHLGYRLSLDHLATVTLGVSKSANGLQALQWWKQGRMDRIVAYCRDDVAITRDLFLFGRNNGYVLFKDRTGHRLRIPVDWGKEFIV